MKWSNIFNFSKKCAHDKVPIEEDLYYCPDCGSLVENHWYIVRCNSCGVKEVATIINGEICPEENYCHNCGCRDYRVEKLDKIDCININYAVLVKEVVNTDINEYTQSWIEASQTSFLQQKLLK